MKTIPRKHMKSMPKPFTYRVEKTQLIRSFFEIQTDILIDSKDKYTIQNFKDKVSLLLTQSNQEFQDTLRQMMKDGEGKMLLSAEISDRLENENGNEDRFIIEIFDGGTYLFGISSRDIDF